MSFTTTNEILTIFTEDGYYFIPDNTVHEFIYDDETEQYYSPTFGYVTDFELSNLCNND